MSRIDLWHATPSGFCADPDIVERRRRPVARRGCGCGEGQGKLRCPLLRKVQMSARVASPFHRRDPRPLLLCLWRQHRFFHFDVYWFGVKGTALVKGYAAEG